MVTYRSDVFLPGTCRTYLDSNYYVTHVMVVTKYSSHRCKHGRYHQWSGDFCHHVLTFKSLNALKLTIVGWIFFVLSCDSIVYNWIKGVFVFPMILFCLQQAYNQYCHNCHTMVSFSLLSKVCDQGIWLWSRNKSNCNKIWETVWLNEMKQ